MKVLPECMLAEPTNDDQARSRLMELEARGWVSEPKLDGMRARVKWDEVGRVSMYARGSTTDTSRRFPETTKALTKLALRNVVADAEIGFMVTPSRMDVHELQKRASTNTRKIMFHADARPMTAAIFDILHARGESVMKAPYHERRSILQQVVTPATLVTVVPQRLDVVEHYDEVVNAGGEGVVVKDPSAPYVNQRSPAWVKVKGPAHVDNLHVVGLLAGNGGRESTFGSFVLAKRMGGVFTYWGKAGSGLTNQELVDVSRAAEACRLDACPINEPLPPLGRKVLAWLDGSIRADVMWENATHVQPRYPRVMRVHLDGRK